MSWRLPQVLRQWALKLRHRRQPSSAANGTNVWKPLGDRGFCHGNEVSARQLLMGVARSSRPITAGIDVGRDLQQPLILTLILVS